MTHEQALQILLQALVLKPGLSIQEAAAVVQAWNTIAEVLKPKDLAKEPPKE